MKNTMKAIAALIISATMISITACGNTDNTSSAPPKATTTASSTGASATTTTEATLTSQSEKTTSLSATTMGTSASTKSTSSSKSSTTPKNTAKANSSKASNGGTVKNDQNYSHSTANNGSGNNSYSNDNNDNNSYQPQQTERQTERQTEHQTTTTAKKTQAPKPKPTTTTTAKPKFELTQSDIDRLQKELQAYSNELARPRVEKIYAQFGYSSVDEFLADTADINLDTASWMTGDNVYAHEKYADVLQSLKEEIQDEYSYYDEHNLTQSIIIIQAGTDYYGHSCWNTYLLRA